MSELVWTNEQPKVSGYYWFRASDLGVEVVEVVMWTPWEPEPEVYHPCFSRSAALANVHGMLGAEWAGPIERPGEGTEP